MKLRVACYVINTLLCDGCNCSGGGVARWLRVRASCPRAVGGTARVFRHRRSSPLHVRSAPRVTLHFTYVQLRAPSRVQKRLSLRARPPRVKNSTHPSQYYPPSPTRAPTQGHAAAARRLEPRVKYLTQPSSATITPPSHEEIRSVQTTGINTECLDQFLRFTAHRKVENSGKSNIFLDFM